MWPFKEKKDEREETGAFCVRCGSPTVWELAGSFDPATGEREWMSVCKKNRYHFIPRVGIRPRHSKTWPPKLETR
jgi:hypothetical protein